MSDINGLRGKKPSQTYRDLLHVSNSNSGIDDTLRPIYDGAGNELPIKISRSACYINFGGSTIVTEEDILLSEEGINGCTIYDPFIQNILHGSPVPLWNLSFAELDYYDYIDGDASNSDNCEIITGEQTEIHYDAVQNSFVSLTGFGILLEDFKVVSNIKDDEVLYFTVIVSPDIPGDGGTSINGAFGQDTGIKFPGGAYPVNNNIYNGPCIIRYFFVNRTGGTVSSDTSQSEFFGIIESQNLQ